jgi:ribosome-associated translation inhibitor RaiA
MRLGIRSENLEITGELRESIERRLRFVLGRFGQQIVRVTVQLADLDSPGKVRGKSCRIAVRLLRSGQVCVEDTESELGTVVDRATARVAQAVDRELKTQRQ